MTRLVKIIDNKYVQIEEYRNPNICFNTNEYSDFEDYCTLRETFNPFKMFYENQELKKQLKKYKDKINWYENFEVNKTIDKLRLKHNAQQKEFIKYLENMLDDENDIFSVVRVKDVLQKYKEIIGDDK